jgi:hypothetical protein
MNCCPCQFILTSPPKSPSLLQEQSSEKDTNFQELNFNDSNSDGPIPRARAWLIDYKNIVIILTLYVMDPAFHVTLKMTFSS